MATKDNITKQTLQDRSKLLSKTVYSLPDNPSDKGFSASQIKSKMYEGTILLFDWLNTLEAQLHTAFDQIDSEKEIKYNLNNVRYYSSLENFTADLSNLDNGQLSVIKDSTNTKFVIKDTSEISGYAYLTNYLSSRAVADENGNNIKSSYGADLNFVKSGAKTLILQLINKNNLSIATKTVSFDNATTSTDGFLSKEDKAKIDDLDQKEDKSNKVTSVSAGSTDTQYPSAKLFYDTREDLQGKIDNLQSIGRFLSLWNSATGQPTTQPTSLPYQYKTGDYFIISNVPSGSATKYMPNGTSYTGTSADKTTTTDDLGVGDYFVFDGTQWKFLINTTKEITFAQIAGQPSDNSNLVTYLHDNFVPFSSGFENYFQIVQDYDSTTGTIQIAINTSVIGESYNSTSGVLSLTFPS